MTVDVEAIGCDMLSATGRKFLRGPRGTGFLYVRREMLQRLEPPMIDHFAAPWVSRGEYRLRDDARRFETWENNYAARLGLGTAIDYALVIGLGPIEQRCRLLADRLRGGLASVRGVTIRDLGRAPGAIVSFTMEGMRRTRSSAAPPQPASRSVLRIRRAPASMPKFARCRRSCAPPRITTIRKPRSIG